MTKALTAPPTQIWAREIVKSPTSPFRVFSPRPAHLVELLSVAARWPDRTAVVYGDNRHTFGQFFAGCASLGEELRRRGVRQGDRVAILGRNSPAWLQTFWAAQLIDAVPVLLNAWWTERELHHVLDMTAPSFVIVDDEFAHRLPAGTRHLSMHDVAALEVSVVALSRPAATEEDTAVIVCTSGTTSLPKGVELSHRALVATELNLLMTTRRIPGTYEETGPVPAAIIAGPLFHMAGLQLHLITWLVGGSVVLLQGRFDAPDVLRTMARENVTTFSGVPTMMARMLDVDPASVPAVPTLRSVGLGGAPVSHAMIDRVAQRFPNVSMRVSNTYGMTETGGGVTSSSGRDSMERPGTSGKPFPLVELRIENPDNDGIGEVCIRTPSQMTRYVGSEENPVDAEGWVHSGDLGRLDGDGYLYIVGRAKDVIIRGGENIAAAVVEGALAQHPAVAEAVAVALPDEDFGEVVGAVVVPRAGASIDLDELSEHARSHLAYFEVPARWWLYEGALPTNEPGKVDKRALAAAFPMERAH